MQSQVEYICSRIYNLMRNKFIVFLIIICFGVGKAIAQDYSNRGLVQIKEQTESMRLQWNKVFEEALINKNFTTLPIQRLQFEKILDQHIQTFRQMMSQGDERPLLVAVNNYLQIQRQYLKNTMIPAEGLKSSDADGISKVNQQTAEFAQKERIFLLEFNNAASTSNMDEGPTPKVDNQEEENEDDLEEKKNTERRGSVIGDTPRMKKKSKLPHEMTEEERNPKKNKRSKNKSNEETEEE